MSTKPPSSVREAQADSLDKIIYQSVADIPAEEPNDRNRLGYTIWLWLQDPKGSLEDAVRESGARLHISRQEAVGIIGDNLTKAGVRIDAR